MVALAHIQPIIIQKVSLVVHSITIHRNTSVHSLIVVMLLLASIQIIVGVTSGHSDIQTLLDQGKFAVIPVDMCGAIAMKRSFPTHIIYVARDKEKLIADIIDSDYDTEEKTLRILSIDALPR